MDKRELNSIMARAEIVWNNPDYFKSFEREEVGVLTELFVPDMTVVRYILWGVTHRSNRRIRCCQYTEVKKNEPDCNNGIQGSG